MSRTTSIAVAVALVVAACGGGETTTTEPQEDPTSQASIAPTAASSTTAAPETTTTTVETTTTTVDTTTTTAALSSDPLVVLAEEKVASIEAAVPEDWTFETMADVDGAEDNELFQACLGEGDFDLAQLGAVTAAAYDVDIDSPVVGIFGSASGSVEVRVFQSDVVAGEAFATLEKILGTDEGRTCLGNGLAQFMAADLGEDSEVSVAIEPGLLPGDAAARLIVDIAASGLEAVLYWDLVASRVAECTVFAVFTSFDEPFDDELAATFLAAAFGG